MKKKIFALAVMAVFAVAAGLYISRDKSEANTLSDLAADNVKALATVPELPCMVVSTAYYNCAALGDSACPCGSNGW